MIDNKIYVPTRTCPRALRYNLTVAGLLTSPGSGLLKAKNFNGIRFGTFYRGTQLRAQSRIHTGFPIESAGNAPGRDTTIHCENTKKSDKMM